MNEKNAKYWIERLELMEHPEGGYFKETYRSAESIDRESLPTRYVENRVFGTSIYFLLTADSISKFHRLKSDEVWHYHQGGAARIHFISPNGEYYSKLIGSDLEDGELLQVIIPKHSWFSAEVIRGEFILVGCTVAPGFEFEDFELARQADLLTNYPQFESVIRNFTD